MKLGYFSQCKYTARLLEFTLNCARYHHLTSLEWLHYKQELEKKRYKYIVTQPMAEKVCKDPEEIVEKMETYFNPKRNNTYKPKTRALLP